MRENVVGAMSYPFAVAVNFRINGGDYLVPMVIEESSVAAAVAASNAARMLREEDRIVAKSGPQYILEKKEEIMELANQQDPVLVRLGGGTRDVEVRVIETSRGLVVAVHLIVDVLDAMGANSVNTMVEAIAPLLEKISGGEARLRIVSNYATHRIVRTWARTNPENVGGIDVAEKIVEAYLIAKADPYRAVTHNKGIMNGIIAVALATAQDHRAIEAGAHAYAARTGRYKPLSSWEIDREGYLVGTLEIPLQVGVVGGAVRVHPVAKIALKILGVKTARELAEVLAAVGLAQNLAALRALAHEGIQRGHMTLHARNIAITAGATGDLIDLIAERMVEERNIGVSRARELLEEFKRKGIG